MIDPGIVVAGDAHLEVLVAISSAEVLASDDGCRNREPANQVRRKQVYAPASAGDRWEPIVRDLSVKVQTLP